MIGSTCLGTEDEPRLKSVLQPSSWCLFRVLLESLFRRASILLSQPSILLVSQLILSSQFIFSQACMAGILFAKFTTPTSRAETIIFSKNALITLRNGSLYLVIRVADLRCRLLIKWCWNSFVRSTRLIGCTVSGQFISCDTTDEGEVRKSRLKFKL